MYAATQQEQLLCRFKQHYDRHEMNAAARLLGILRLVYTYQLITLLTKDDER